MVLSENALLWKKAANLASDLGKYLRCMCEALACGLISGRNKKQKQRF